MDSQDSGAAVAVSMKDWLDRYECPEHGTYWTSKGAPPECPSCSDPENPGQVSASDVRMMLNRAGVNVHAYRDATLESFDGSRDPDVLPTVEEWLDRWSGDSWHPRPWLYLYGAGSDAETIGRTGNGKTHIAVAIMRALMASGEITDHSAEFLTAEEFLLRVEDCRSESRAILPEVKRLGKLRLLVIDDLGTRSYWSDNTVRVVVELARLRESKATIWTSNLSPKALAASSDTLRRLVSRIQGECENRFLVEFAGPDRRLGGS